MKDRTVEERRELLKRGEEYRAVEKRRGLERRKEEWRTEGQEGRKEDMSVEERGGVEKRG